jgi:lipopolysaccharide/colanic/teichoic acid biosynthesis glycosyltransferase
MRRLLDVVIALLVLPLLSPVFLLVSLAVVLETPGGPFYAARRIGKGGKPFRMWKFRSMVSNADRIGAAITVGHDSRITRVGWFLRKTKLDELPQVLNLLAGDLTLVGPRPEDPGIIEEYTPEQRKVLEVKPGITGPTQLRYTVLEAELISEAEDPARFYVDKLLNDKVRLDLEYIKRQTFFSDCFVVFQTLVLIARVLTSTETRQQLEADRGVLLRAPVDPQKIENATPLARRKRNRLFYAGAKDRQ